MANCEKKNEIHYEKGILEKYLEQMNIIIKRQEVINNIMAMKKTTGYYYSDIEICVLQIRKIIELMAFGSVVTSVGHDKEILKKCPKWWNSKLVFNEIERINKDYFPRPVENGNGTIIELCGDYTTKEEILKIYDKCGKFLHSDNPYASPHDIEYYEKNIAIWNKRISQLLNRHIIRLSDGNLYFICMKFEKTGKSFGCLFEAV